jgi:hypothetical protein
MVTQYIVNFTDPERSAFVVNPFTTDGPVAPNTLELSSSAVTANTSLLLYGKGHVDYGERIQENLINLMENFSGASEPQFPITGQTWFSRITYAFVGLGSPVAANIYRWEDDSTLTNGGRWITLTNTGAVNPTVADEVKTSGAQPTTVVDGSFWLDTQGSPLVPELYLGVNDSSSNLSASFIKREMEDLTGLVGPGGRFIGQIGGSPELREFLPQKQLKVYDGVQWKNAGNVYVSHVPPQAPAIGDMWYRVGVVGSPPAGSPALGGGGGPLSQLFIWARPGPGKSPRWLSTGYLDRSGDVMTGTLSFGLPISSLFLWEGQGDDTVGADLRTTGNALLTSEDDFYIHFDDVGSPPAGAAKIFEVAARSRSRGSHVSLFQVRGDGIIRSSFGSPTGSPNTYRTLLLNSNDDNALINKAYVDDVIAVVGSLTAQVNDNTANIITLAGSPIPGSPNTGLTGKVNRTGDTMTGTLTFLNIGSPVTGNVAIDAGLFLISNVQTPVGPDDAATKNYVDGITAALGSPIVDRYVDTLTLDWITAETITLTRTGGLGDLSGSLVHNHPSDQFIHTVDTPYLRDQFQGVVLGSPVLFGSPSPFGSPIVTFTVTQEQINDTVTEDFHCRIDTLEHPTEREVFFVGVGSPLAAGGSPTNNLTLFTFTEDSYVAGTNRLQVFVNGVKQYANERAFQRINLTTGTGLSPTARTELTQTTTYTLEMGVDGGSPIQRMSDLGSNLETFQKIIDKINAQIAGVTAVWSKRDTAIVVYSNTTGTGSAINIFESSGSPTNNLLQNLATTNAGTGSPRQPSYTLGNISPVAGGPVSTVLRNLSYREIIGSPIVDATYGQTATTIQFNASLAVNDSVELLAFPAFF